MAARTGRIQSTRAWRTEVPCRDKRSDRIPSTAISASALVFMTVSLLLPRSSCSSIDILPSGIENQVVLPLFGNVGAAQPALNTPTLQETLNQFPPFSTPSITPTNNANPGPPLRLSHDSNPPASSWQPTLSLRDVTNPVDESLVLLTTREILRPGPGWPTFLLEGRYTVQGSFPRSYFVVMQQNSISHSFIFDFPENAWFQDLSGLRKSAYVNIRAEGSDDVWELHLKPSRDKSNIFGYLCKHTDMVRIISEQQNNLLKTRRLPLVLDLDDTLVRLVGNEPGRYVPENVLPQIVPHRIRELRDGRRVVLTDRVYEFLEWAAKYFEISVCSLGDQAYVDMVVSVLDPSHTRIRGIQYSARQEYDYISRSPQSRRPPKDLLALYAFCAVREPRLGSGFSLPLIVDDLTGMWPVEQHDNIIVVKEKKGSPVWTVNLFPIVQNVLQNVYNEFFRQLDQWQMGTVLSPPSAVAVYKEILRAGLRDQIAER